MAVSFQNYVYIPERQKDAFFSRHPEFDFSQVQAENKNIRKVLDAEHICTHQTGLYILVKDKYSDFQIPSHRLSREIVQIEKGDSLSRITKKYNLKSWKVLQKLNRIKDPSLIHIGEFVILPKLPASYKEPSPVQVGNLLPEIDKMVITEKTTHTAPSAPSKPTQHEKVDSHSSSNHFKISTIDLSEQRQRSVKAYKDLEAEMEDSVDNFFGTLMETLAMGTPTMEKSPEGKLIAGQVRNVFGALKLKKGKRWEIKAFGGLFGIEKSNGKSTKFVRLFTETFRVKIDDQGLFHFKSYGDKIRATGVGKVFAVKFDYIAWQQAQEIAKNKGIDAGVKFLEKSNKALGLSFDPKTTARALREVPSMKEMKALSLASLSFGIGFAALLSYIDTKYNLKLTPSTRAFLVNAVSEAAIGLMRMKGVSSLAGIFTTGNAYFFALFECWGLAYDVICDKLGWDRSPLGRGVTQAIGTLATRFGYYKLKDLMGNIPPPGNNFPGGTGANALRTGISFFSGSSTSINLTTHLGAMGQSIQTGWNTFKISGANWLSSFTPQTAIATAHAGNTAKGLQTTNTARNMGTLMRSMNGANVTNSVRMAAQGARATVAAGISQAGQAASSVTVAGIARAGGLVLIGTQFVDYLAEKYVGEEKASIMHAASRKHFEEEIADSDHMISRGWTKTKRFMVQVSGVETMHGNSILDDDEKRYKAMRTEILKAGKNGIDSIRNLIPYLAIEGIYVKTPGKNDGWTVVRDEKAMIAIMDIFRLGQFPTLSKEDQDYIREVDESGLAHDARYKEAMNKYITLSLLGAAYQAAFASHIKEFKEDESHQDILKYVRSGIKMKDPAGLLQQVGLKNADRIFDRVQDLRQKHTAKAAKKYTCYTRSRCKENENEPDLVGRPNAANIFDDEMISYVETPIERKFNEKMMAKTTDPENMAEAYAVVSEAMREAQQDVELEKEESQKIIANAEDARNKRMQELQDQGHSLFAAINTVTSEVLNPQDHDEEETSVIAKLKEIGLTREAISSMD